MLIPLRAPLNLISQFQPPLDTLQAFLDQANFIPHGLADQRSQVFLKSAHALTKRMQFSGVIV